MAIIHILDKHTAELIAAGEVVERPSSVVKELLENAIDANSKNISVHILNGGIQEIEIQDDGDGIEPDEIPKAFIRHATSKIATADDLDSINTLGFRGEALASIASVSKVTLVSKTNSSEFAMQYIIEGGEEKSFDVSARPNGTTITVKNLFYNTPARMKFLKKDQSEASYIQEIVLRIALSHPEISFQFTKEEKLQFHTPGNGDLLTTIHSLLGASFADTLISVSIIQDGSALTGYITKPSASRGSRSMQFFYINGRYIKNATMMAALEQAYKGTTMSGKFPGCILHLTIPAEKIDVNVHPAKTEVRFSNEREVFNTTYQCVKNALITPESQRKEITLDNNIIYQKSEISNSLPQQAYNFERLNTVKPNNLTFESEELLTEKERINTYNSMLFSTSTVPYSRTSTKEIDIEVDDDSNENFYSNSDNINSSTYYAGVHSPIQDSEINEKPVFEIRVIGEIFKTYIVIQSTDEISFIDKHAAHERILYDKLISGLTEVAGQTLLAPVDVQLSANEKDILTANEETLLKTGIALEDFGGNSVLVRTVPPNVTEAEIPALISEIAQKLLNNSIDTFSEKQNWIYASIACRGAIKAGDFSSEIEMINLAESILNGTTQKFCPHGRPIVLTLTQKEIEKYFGRLG